MTTPQILETSYCTRKIDHNHEDDRIAFETHSTPESTNIAREQRGYRKAPGKDGIKGMSFMELPGHRLGMVGNWKSCKSVGITILETYLEGYMVAPIAMPYLPGVSSMFFFKCWRSWNQAVLWPSRRTGLRREGEAPWT
ncbi:hypothetical protein BDP67DRAFT_293080 [Colletotrichum lupini]|nr:hypothetical protein BDP67DRAFT_293080 [Colletotrichum lupini]